MYRSLERRHSYAPYKKGIHGEGRNLETVFSDPQVTILKIQSILALYS